MFKIEAGRPQTPQEKYDKENTQSIGLKLSKKYDTDILSAIEGKAKQTEIKRLIRLGLDSDVSVSESEEEIGMTDYQFKVILKAIMMIIESSNSKEEALQKIKGLIKEN